MSSTYLRYFPLAPLPAPLGDSWFVLEISLHCRRIKDTCIRLSNCGGKKIIIIIMMTWFSLAFTCILLRQHWSVDNSLKCSNPIRLILFSLTCKKELPVWGYYSYSKLPVVALSARREARKHNVAVLLTTNEHLTSCIGILWTEGHA